MVEVVVVAFVVITVLFGFVLLFGAPYLPTLTPQVNTALDLIQLKKDDHLLELGCGDGRVLIAAAERGIRVTGYEINPLLAAVAWLRTRRYKGRARVVWGNFWRKKLPPAEGIFVFLLPKYMQKLDKKIIQESSKPVKLVSFAFIVPGLQPDNVKQGMYLYTYNEAG